MKKFLFAAVAVSAMALSSAAFADDISDNTANLGLLNGNTLAHRINSDDVNVDYVDVSGNKLLSDNTLTTNTNTTTTVDTKAINKTTTVDVTKVDVNIGSGNTIAQSVGDTIGANSGITTATANYIPVNSSALAAPGMNDLSNIHTFSATAVGVNLSNTVSVGGLNIGNQ